MADYSDDFRAGDFFPTDDWIKVGSGEKTGFMVNFPIPGTPITMSYDAGDKFWNLSDEDKTTQALYDALQEIRILQDQKETDK